MIRPSNSSLKVYVYSEPVDMRKQIDGLTALVQLDMALEPFSKSLFVFTNKRRDKLKILAWVLAAVSKCIKTAGLKMHA